MQLQALEAATKGSGSREGSRDKGKINLLAISRFEDLSQRLISLGCGFSCWLFKSNLSKTIHLILYGVFLLGHYPVKYIIIIRL